MPISGPVSGATLTSSAVIDGAIARARAQEQLEAPRPGIRFGLQDAAITLWGVVGFGLTVTRLRKARRARAAFRVLVVVWHLGFGGGLVALSLLTGWAMHGPAWRTAPALTAFVLAMIALPLLLGKNTYCQELCPHGIIQGWLRRVPGVRASAISQPIRHGLRWLAPGLLAVAILVVLLDLPRDLAGVEPFDTYPLWRSGTWAWGATLVVFAVGLLFSLRYPMSYCQYGCPSGWLLRAAVSRRSKRLWAGADLVLVLLLLITAGVVLAGHNAWHQAHPMDHVPTLMTPSVGDEVDPRTRSHETLPRHALGIAFSVRRHDDAYHLARGALFSPPADRLMLLISDNASPILWKRSSRSVPSGVRIRTLAV